MTRYLVTGATTPLGAAVVDALLARSDTRGVLAVGREGAAYKGSAGRHEYLPRDLTKDRVRRDLLFGVGRERGVEVIVHTVSHRDARDRGPAVHRLNVDATRELYLLADSDELPQIRRFVYLSHGEVYRTTTSQPTLIGEEHPVDLRPSVPQRVRDRVEADLFVCSQMGMRRTETVVLRCAEIFAPASGSQLWDYVAAQVCFRPVGFDPMLNLLSLADACNALTLAATATGNGVYNIPGADTMPLSRLIRKCGRKDVPVPGPLLGPLYSARRLLRNTQFRYDLNAGRFHLGGILDGARAERELGYRATHPIEWKRLNHREAAAWPVPQRLQ